MVQTVQVEGQWEGPTSTGNERGVAIRTQNLGSPARTAKMIFEDPVVSFGIFSAMNRVPAITGAPGIISESWNLFSPV
jgi:hypothetical protein